MITSDLTLSIVTAISLFVFVVEAESLDQVVSVSEQPFLILIPEDRFDRVDSSTPIDHAEPKLSKKRSVTSVEIVKSIEVNLDKLPESSIVPSSSSTDLVFSDSDRKSKQNETSRQSTRNRSLRYRRLKTSASSQHSSSIPPQAAKENLLGDDLDFNSRILLSNILIRKSKEEDDENKYSSYSEPKIAGNKPHPIYINRNFTATTNKSRVNVKFPPKIFPIRSPSVSRSNKTAIPYHHTSSKNQTQRNLYRGRLAKPSFQSRYKKKQNSTETIPSKNKIEKDQSVTHWDFGKKTTSEPNDEEEDKTVNSEIIEIDPVSIDITTSSPNHIHYTRSTTQPTVETTPEAFTENVVNIGHKVLVHNSKPNRQSDRINNFQSTTSLPTVNAVQSQFDVIQVTTPQPSLSTARNVNTFQRTSPEPIRSVPAYSHVSSLQGPTIVPPVNNIKNPQVYYTHNGNIIKQDDGTINKYQGKDAIPSNIAQNQLKQTSILQQGPIYGINVLRQNLGPQLFHNHDYRNEEGFKTRSQQRVNAGRLQELRNWQPVYFVPHVSTSHQQQHPVPAPPLPQAPVVTLRTGPQTVPIFLEQPPKSANILQQEVYPGNIIARSSVPVQDDLFYEGVLVAYPEDIHGEPSDILPFYIE